ncbi:MAG: WG repeat-containing protein [Muribaculaceae bacterium]|nr:WG repeat-containing protein [Muribaculaceae bacterium]
MEGEQLYSTTDRITKFYDGLATVLKKETSEITGIIDTDGKYKSLPHLTVAYNHPHFDNGFLIAKRKGKFTMFSKDAKEQDLPELATIYPFTNGYAVYMAYENPEKLKKPYYNYLKPDGLPLERFMLKEKDKEKPIEPKKIRFLSAVDKDGKSIAVIKDKLYQFNASDESLTPILMGDESEKKRHLTVLSNNDQDFIGVPNENLRFQARYGKDQQEEYEFDNRLRLISKEKSKTNKPSSPATPSSNIESNIDIYQENGVYGLILNGKDSIPCQFEQVGLTYGNNAFVKSKGKWGVLELVSDINVDLNLNNGEVITFRHQNFPTQLHIDVPCSIQSKGIRIDATEIEGCSIDLSSKENRDTKNGNYIVYNCTLAVPQNLTDSVSTINFGPVELIHENVRLHAMPIHAKGQYVKPYSIDIVKNDLTVDKNDMTEFDINVNISKEEGEEEDYPYVVDLKSESLQTKCEKISENNYRCYIEYADEGSHDLDVILTETNCPPCVFPLELTCSKNGRAVVRHRVSLDPIENDTVQNPTGPEKTELKKNVSGKKNSRSTALTSKAPLFVKYDDGYLVGEVTDPNAKLCSGPGNDFPAPTYTIEGVGKTEIPVPFKGQLIKVKEEGDWYLRYPSVATSQSPEPEYISKKSVTPIKSTSFNLKEIAEPCIYVSSQEIYDEANNKLQYIDEVVTYPDGVCIEYSEGASNSLIKFGNIIDGKPAIQWKYRIQTCDGGETKDGDKSSVAIDNGNSMHRLRLSIAPQDKKTLKVNKRNIEYLDLTGITADEWIGILKDYLLTADTKYDKHEVAENECDIVTKNMLEKNYTKVNK